MSTGLRTAILVTAVLTAASLLLMARSLEAADFVVGRPLPANSLFITIGAG